MAGKIGDKESLQMLKNVLFIFGGSACAFIAVLLVHYSVILASPQKQYSIMFADGLSFNDNEESTWLINNQNGNSEKLLLAYRTSSSSVPDIVKSSDLVDESWIHKPFTLNFIDND